jgi:hypothetical protein
MSDVFVTLVSVQPAVAVRDLARSTQQNAPQTTGLTHAGLYEAIRHKQVIRAKKAPPGAT